MRRLLLALVILPLFACSGGSVGSFVGLDSTGDQASGDGTMDGVDWDLVDLLQDGQGKDVLPDTGPDMGPDTEPLDVDAWDLVPDLGDVPDVEPDEIGDPDVEDVDVTDLTDVPDVVPECVPGTGCFLEACAEDDDCAQGPCVEHLGGLVCSKACEDTCEPGWACTQVRLVDEEEHFCISQTPTLCRPCKSTSDCHVLGNAASACVPFGTTGTFCGAACELDEQCPAGYQCADMVTVDGSTSKQCVLLEGQCQCTDYAVSQGFAGWCFAGNEFGTCQGQQICTAEGYSACDAPVPAADLCNGVDDDCNGTTDEVPCDDSLQCTEDICLGAEGCSFAGLSGTQCEDGDKCTINDICDVGVCVATPVVCDDENECTQDSCDPETGECLFVNIEGVCDDGDPCTVTDACKEGVCTGFQLDCSCQIDSDCAELEDGNLCNGTLKCDVQALPYRCSVDVETVVSCPPAEGLDAPCLAPSCDPLTGECSLVAANEGMPCSDGNACTIADICMEGKCTGGQPANCNDGNVCTDDSCDPASGCLHVNNTAACNDGNYCSTGDICENGQCAGISQKDCNDNNICTDDSCDANFGCVHVVNTNGCDDGNLCTQNDMCMDGVCLPGSAIVCDDLNICTDDKCDPVEGCMFVSNSAPCDDNSLCTIGDKCMEGACVSGAEQVCDDANGCTDEYCDPAVGCVTVPNIEACDDGNLCTENDVCFEGSCKPGTALVCDDENICTDDKCTPLAGCVFVNNSVPCDDADACTLMDKCFEGACQSGPAPVCDDKNPCTDEYCDPAVGCVYENNTDGCDDGNLCTENDVCFEGSCTPGTALVCNDDNICTNDSCKPLEGCLFVNNMVPCDDGDACTSMDKCGGGACNGGPAVVCDDKNPCTDDSCDPEVGCVFKHNTVGCDDGNLCTENDVCFEGSCKPGTALVCNDDNICTNDSCKPLEGCVYMNNAVPCDDGDACTSMDKCGGGACNGGPAVVCDDKNPCTDDSCDPEVGCVFKNNTVGCDDGNLCTENDVCAAGVCKPGTALVCNDDNICTNDSCKPLDGCVYVNNTVPCDDGNACTTLDKCGGGTCNGGPALGCNDNNECTLDECDTNTGCVHTPQDTVCDDGIECTLDVCSLSSGCVNTPVAALCDDGNECTNDLCVPVLGGCRNTANTDPCDDGNGCTIGDKCADKVCSGLARVLISVGEGGCDDGNLCTTDGCDVNTGNCSYLNNTLSCNDGNICTGPDVCGAGSCSGAALSCDDGNPCTDDVCDPNIGCVNTFNTSPCNDGELCTMNDVCNKGICLGYPKALVPVAAGGCDDGNFCTDEACDPGTGACSNPFNTLPCNDSLLCTENDTCGGGVCGGTAVDCDDGNPCTDDYCHPLLGCMNDVNTAFCDDGSACTETDTCALGICSGIAITCNDGNGCTSDSCNPATGCVFVNNTDPCDDGNACTSSDTCSLGTCAGSTITCDDGNVCTDDSCNPATGCVFVNNTDTCDDGSACTSSDTCSLGTCAGSTITCDDENVCTTDTCNPASGCVYTPIPGCVPGGSFTPDGTTISGWTERVGNWYVSNGNLYPDAASGWQWITRDDATATDGCATTRAVFGTGSNLRNVGIVSRFVDSYNYSVMVKLQNNGSGPSFDSLFIYQDGSVLNNYSNDYGTDAILQLQMSGTSGTVRVDTNRDGTWDYVYNFTTKAPVGGNWGAHGYGGGASLAYFNFGPTCF